MEKALRKGKNVSVVSEARRRESLRAVGGPERRASDTALTLFGHNRTKSYVGGITSMEPGQETAGSETWGVGYNQRSQGGKAAKAQNSGLYWIERSKRRRKAKTRTSKPSVSALDTTAAEASGA
jgi:hypothetical protein